MQKIPRDSWAMIQCVIRRFPENKTEYDNAREEILESTPVQDGQPHGNFPGNRLEAAVIQLNAPRMERMKREIEAVDKAYAKLQEDHRKVIRIRFWSDRYRNMPYVWMQRNVSYSEVQMKRICKAFIYEVGKNLGEI